jgi:N-acyl homoserine lactone hydrolase
LSKTVNAGFGSSCSATTDLPEEVKKMADSISRRSFLHVAGAAAVSACTLAAPTSLVAKTKSTVPEASDDVKAYAFICGILKTQTQYLLKDTRVGTPFNIPVPFMLIKHGKDWVGFDTGNNAMVAKDPVKYWGKPVTDAYFPVMKDYEEFKVQIKKLGLEPKDLKAVIISHGHLDHAGAIDNFVGTDVPIYIQKKELEVIKKAVASGKRTAYIPDDFKVMDRLNIKGIDGVYDVFGDQTVVAFPTPGHSPGHQSVMVKEGPGKSLVLAADAMYTLENMQEAIPPGLAWDIPRSLQALYMFKVMKCMDSEVVPSHDPEYWKKQTLGPKVFGS